MQIYLQIFSFFMRYDEKLNRIKEILPYNVGRRTKRSQGVKIGIRHPYTERSILLTKRLSGSDGRDARHSLWRRSRINENILIITPFAFRRQFIANILTKPELKQAHKERR